MKKLLLVVVLVMMLTVTFSPLSVVAQAAPADDLQTVVERGVLRVGMEAGYAPYNYRQTTDVNGAVAIANQNGEFANGYDVKIAKYIAEQMGVTLEVHALEWDSLINALNAGTIDAIIAGMSPTEERKEAIDFSDKYYESNLVIVVRKDGKFSDSDNIEDFVGANIAAQRGTFHVDALEQITTVTDTNQYDTFATMITALKANTIDGYIAEEPGAIADCTANSELMYVPIRNNENGFTTAEGDTQLAVGLRKGSSLTAEINSILATVSDDQRAEWMDEAIAQQPVESVERGFFGNVAYILGRYWTKILQGVGTTILVSIVGTVAGMVIGLLVGFIRTLPTARTKAGRIWQKVYNFVFSAYVEIFRGTPMMVQAMVIYWGYALLNNGVTMNTFVAALLIVSVNTGAYITEIVRGGINALDKGQFEGSSAIGMTHWQTLRYVILPQTVKNILPAVSNEFVINIKDTSVLSVLAGFIDLYAVGNIIILGTYRTFEAYLIISVVYFILTFCITRLLRFFERKLNGKSNYALYNSDIVSAAPNVTGE